MMDYLTALGLAIASAKDDWELSKQVGGRPRGRRGKNESGDAYFLGVVGGLGEARTLFQKMQTPKRGAIMRSSGAMIPMEVTCRTTMTE